jgi:hypothetical protein
MRLFAEIDKGGCLGLFDQACLDGLNADPQAFDLS